MATSSILPIETDRLIIRNWQERDRALFHEVNSDDAVMEFFAMRRNRKESDEMMDWLTAEIDRVGYGFTAIERKSDHACLGFCGLSPLNLAPWFPQGTVEIGWRIAKRYWGEGYVTEGAKALLQAGFGALDLHAVVAIAVPENRRSTAVMDRLGMTRDMAADFDHPKVPDSAPTLKRHGTWRLTKQSWLQNQTRLNQPGS
jgi:RimJ/RimL family protein N-acetyltransferase